jgi:hypothetical protein
MLPPEAPVDSGLQVDLGKRRVSVCGRTERREGRIV